MAIDFERISKRHGETLGKQIRLITGFCSALQHHEFVAPEAGDQIGWADDRTETVRHLLEQFVADRVTESVVNALETIEVDEVNCDLVIGCKPRTKNIIDAL